jgi:hypothetical protein
MADWLGCTDVLNGIVGPRRHRVGRSVKMEREREGEGEEKRAGRES